MHAEILIANYRISLCRSTVHNKTNNALVLKIYMYLDDLLVNVVIRFKNIACIFWIPVVDKWSAKNGFN